jgi:hypothetical protein
MLDLNRLLFFRSHNTQHIRYLSILAVAMIQLTRVNILMLIILLIHSEILTAQTSRLSFEPIAFMAYGSSRFKSLIFTTTPDDFLRVTSFGATYDHNGKVQGAFSRSPEPYFQYGGYCFIMN